MAFMPQWFERKSAADDRATSHAVSASPSAQSVTYASGTLDGKNHLSLYEKVLMVFRCVDAVASNQMNVPIYVFVGGKEGRIEDNPKLNRLLNIRPNKYETAAQFRYRISSLALLHPKGVFLEVVGPLTDPESLHILPSESVEPIPDPKKYVSGFRVLSASGAPEPEPLKPEQVIWIRLKPHPTDPYKQVTPLGAAKLPAETDFFARLFNRNFLMNDGRPGLLITLKGRTSAEDAAELKRRFGGGYTTAGRTSVIESDGLDVADLSASPRDVQWIEASRASKEDIMLAFGTPESVLGNASGRTFDNADAEYELFWTHTMINHCDAIAGAFDVFTGRVDDNRTIGYDYSTIDVLQRQKRRRNEEWMQRWLQGGCSWNEYRKNTGQEEWETLAARIVVLPSGIAMAKDPADQAEIPKLPIVGQQPGGPAGQLPALAAQQAQQRQALSSYQGARQGSLEGSRNFDNVISARALALAGKTGLSSNKENKQETFNGMPILEGEVVSETKEHPYRELRSKTENMLQGLMLGWGKRQGKVCSERLDHAKVRKGTRHWDGVTEGKALRGLDPYYVVEVDDWADEMVDDFRTVLRKAMKQEALRVARDMDANGIIDQLNEDGVGDSTKNTPLDRLTGGVNERESLINAVLDEVLNIVDQSTRNQSRRIAEKIKQMDDSGASLPDIKQTVRSMVNEQGSWHKALTTNTTTAAYEGMKHAVYSLGGDYIEKTWNTVEDERVRFSHREADQQTKRVGQPFVIGNSAMLHPGQPDAPVEETANCRCWLSFSVV